MSSNPREKAPLEPVDPAVELIEYDLETGTGILKIEEHRYVLVRLRDGTKTVGMRLSRYCDKRGLRKIDVDFTVSPWQCDCEDATYRGERPGGGCKHMVALKKVAEILRCQRAGGNGNA